MSEEEWGLLAHAAFGQVALDLDESLSTTKRYRLTVTLPGIQLRFAIEDVAAAAELSRFLHEHYRQTVFAELAVGRLDGLVVRLIKDDEYADRFYIRAASDGMVDVEISDPATLDLLRAAKELAASLTTG